MPSTEKLNVTVVYKNGGSIYANVPASMMERNELYVTLNGRVSLLLRLSSDEVAQFQKGEQVSLPELVVVKS